ncbi:MAG: OmpP1/FadL family transporter [bacterium]
MKKWWMILFVYAILLHPNSMQADTLFQQAGITSSPNPVGSGARAMGMGGAFISIADDATAASWNPGGLIQLEMPELSIVGAYLSKREDFSSQRHPEINNTGKANDLNINYFSAAIPFQLTLTRNAVVSLNYQRLYEFERNFNHFYDYSSLGVDLLQYKHYKQRGNIGALGLAYAFEATPRVSFGATLNIWTDTAFWMNGWEESYYEKGVGTIGGNQASIETYINHKYSDFFGLNANIGFLWDMNRYLTLGAVLKTPFNARMRHEYSIRQINSSNSPVSSSFSDSEKVKLRMPPSYGIGLAWRVSDALSFDLDVYRTRWCDYFFIDSDGNEFSPIDGRPKSDADAKNTTQVRFGGEYLIINPNRNIVIPIRAGMFYDPEPSHQRLRRFYGFAVGSGIAYRRIIFDMAYELRWSRDIDSGNLIASSRCDTTQHRLLASLIIHFGT